MASGLSAPGVTPASATAVDKRRQYRALLRAWGPLLVLIVVALLIGLVNPSFFEPRNFVRIATAAVIPLLIAIGETFVIMLGSIDLSLEGVTALSAVLVSMTVLNGRNDNDF